MSDIKLEPPERGRLSAIGMGVMAAGLGFDGSSYRSTDLRVKKTVCPRKQAKRKMQRKARKITRQSFKK